MDHTQQPLISYLHHHHTSTTNAIFSPPLSSTEGNPEHFPFLSESVVRRKRGRPRKYGLPSVTASTSTRAVMSSPSPPKKDFKMSQLGALGKGGQSFTPHIIAVATGEDVAQKIMSFIQKSKLAVCILSGSGSVSNVSLRHPANTDSVVDYEGSFDIISLSGSFLHVEIKGASSRVGGISTCLAGGDGRIIGGGIRGPLIAAGPVQVIAASFSVNNDQDPPGADAKVEFYRSKFSASDLVGTKLNQPSSGARRKTNPIGSGNSSMLHSRGGHSRFAPTNEEVKIDVSDCNTIRKMGMENLFVTRFSSQV